VPHGRNEAAKQRYVITIATVRRLSSFLSANAILQGLLFSALVPLLPSFEEQLELSKARAGLLVGVFAVGQGVATLPVGPLAARVGVKRFVLLGLAVLAVASTAFGFADSYNELLLTRFVQGAAAGLCLSAGYAWIVEAAPPGQRGGVIGLLSGAGSAGQVLGPAVGVLAVSVGRAGVFAGVAALTLLLAFVGSRLPGPTRGKPQRLSLIQEAHRSRAALGGLWLVSVPGLLLGGILALAPLQLDRLGWGPAGIAGTFLVAASVGVVARPLIGRWADRRGLLSAVRALLLCSVPVTLVIPWVDYPWLLSVCVACAVTVYGLLFGPSMAVVSLVYENAGIAQLFGFALMILTTGVALFVGSAAGGEIAHLAGDSAAYTLAAGLSLATAIALALSRQQSSRAVVETGARVSGR